MIKDKRKLAYVIGGIGITMICIGILIQCIGELNQKRCYNLPLNKFYEDKSCMKYTETWEELLGE